MMVENSPTFSIYPPSKKNKQYGSYRYGPANNHRSGGRKEGYPLNEVRNTLNETNLRSEEYNERWCKMKNINPNSVDQIEHNWLDRVITGTHEYTSILLIMKEGGAIHPNSIKDRESARERGESWTWYKVALYDRKNKMILFRSIINCMVCPTVDTRKSNTDCWYQFTRSNGTESLMVADIKFWRRLKKILR